MLIDRERELAVLDSALADCLRATPRVVLIEGAAGCGRSELVETVAERAAAAGAVVLRAIGTAVEHRLPLGVLGQLLAAAPAGTLPDPADAPDPTRIDTMQALCAAVHRLAEQAPVVLCVDDLHHVDDLSCQYLLHLVRRTRASRVLLVGTESVHENGDDPGYRTELLRQRGFVRIRAERLGPDAVARLAAAELAAGPADGRTPPPADAAGGNPLLLRALFEEHRAGGRAPALGGAFTQAVLACLHRCGPAALRLAEALAVLDDLAAPDLAARLTGTAAGAAARGTAALDAAGILDGHRFRHPLARQAVLDRMDPHDRAALHRAAAELAHHDGAPTTAVAAQLLAFGPTDLSWAVPVLAAAADQLLADGAPDLAAACLELACQGPADDGRRAHYRTRLAALTWRTNPSAAERALAAPLETLRAGRLAPDGIAPLARLLTEQGRIDEAADVLDQRPATGRDPERPARTPRIGRTADPLDGLSAFPRWAGHATTTTRSGEPQPARGPAPAVLWALPAYTPDGRAAAETEHFLRGTTLGEATAAPIAQAVRALLAVDGPSRALPWCQVFVEEAARRGAPGWQTAFTALYAEALLRQGDLTGAQQQAEAALDLLPERGGSAFAGGVAATLVRAATAAGQHETAARELGRPLPDGLAGSVHGLAHLYARGHHHLATHRPHAALGDFLEIGRSLRRWGLDRPLLLPWRTGAAETLIQLGETPQAARLLDEQFAHRDAGHPWIAGLTLRVRAALGEPRRRHALLTRAVDELHAAEDRHELARTLADLAAVLRELGDGSRADTVERRARQLAANCGADSPREQPAEGAAGPDDPHTRLSDSEKRVATLAVYGHTNREIARKLYITVSTVEQHLTRVYRKLNITRRQDLPAELHLLGTGSRA
ncbi:AAA family ATPase [Kitasatospora sp. NPDC057198]|uniref:helix-turn-helix transcriptional regulator n=1 Tax=Kitasatospora sp. NPDC057198 TaxID=3346046 RepID=UPI00362FD816